MNYELSSIRALATMIAIRALFPLLFIASSSTALATSTMCDFHGTNGSLTYGLEFIGYGEIAMIQINSPSGLRMSGYKVLEFDERTSKIHLVYTSPGGRGLMPSFTLEGAGKKVRMVITEKQIIGELTCGR